MKDPRTGLPMFLRDTHLDELCRRAPGGAVSFVDESYRPPMRTRGDERAFYSMSAVTFALDRLDDVRETMTEIAGGRYWHTTEVYEAGGRDAIARMGRYIARHSEWNVVTVEMPVPAADTALAYTRATCLAALAREVTRGTGPDAVRLIVADRNKDEQLNRSDLSVLNKLRAVGDVDIDVVLHHGRMAHEPVLWTADTMSWSAYRTLAVDDDRWIAPVRDMLTVLDARTGKSLDMKQPQAAAATGALAPSPGAPQTTGAVRGQSTVASTPSVRDDGRTAPDPAAAAFRPGRTVLDDLARQMARTRATAGAGGYAQGNTPDAITERVRKLRASSEDENRGATDRPTERHNA